MTKKTRRAKARRALLSISLVLVVAFAAVGGTIAWLTDTTSEIKNTFTVGNVDIKLDESQYTRTEDENGNVTGTYGERVEEGNSYPLIPGNSYNKDPKVSVTAGSETCYLFVQYIGPESVDNVEFTPNWGDWTRLTVNDTNGVAGDVYWRIVKSADTTREFFLLTEKTDEDGNKYTIKVDSDATSATAFEMKYKAFAVQKENFNSAALAWEEVSDQAMTDATGN